MAKTGKLQANSGVARWLNAIKVAGQVKAAGATRKRR